MTTKRSECPFSMPSAAAHGCGGRALRCDNCTAHVCEEHACRRGDRRLCQQCVREADVPSPDPPASAERKLGELDRLMNSMKGRKK
jgi:hypothetical protein